jgi:hypothetical protein
MFTTSIKIGPCHMAHATSACKEDAIRKTIELSKAIVVWKENAKPRVTIVYPNGKVFGRTVSI